MAIVFVDSIGGALSSLAAALANAAGKEALAASKTSAAVTPEEVTIALAEIGVPAAAEVHAWPIENAGAHRVVEIPSDVHLHEGPTKPKDEVPSIHEYAYGPPIEKLSAARIARDRLTNLVAKL